MNNQFLTLSSVAGASVVSGVSENPLPVLISTFLTLIIEFIKWRRGSGSSSKKS